MAIVAIHVVFTATMALVGSPNLVIGSSEDGGFRWALTGLTAAGLALMIIALMIQRRRSVSGSRLFAVGLLPSLVSPTGLVVLGWGAWTANLVFSEQRLDIEPGIATGTGNPAPSDRTDMRRVTFKDRWWRFAAGFLALGFAFLGLGNLLEDDGGPLYGRILAAAVAVAAAALIVAGIVIRRRRRRLGSTMIGIGTLPASALILFFWFPPVALAGLLAIVVTVRAFNDATQSRQNEQPAEITS